MSSIDLLFRSKRITLSMAHALPVLYARYPDRSIADHARTFNVTRDRVAELAEFLHLSIPTRGARAGRPPGMQPEGAKRVRRARTLIETRPVIQSYADLRFAMRLTSKQMPYLIRMLREHAPATVATLDARRAPRTGRLDALRAVLIAHPTTPLCDLADAVGVRKNVLYPTVQYLEQKDGRSYREGRERKTPAHLVHVVDSTVVQV